MTKSVEEADWEAIERWKSAGLTHAEVSARLDRRIDERVMAKHKARFYEAIPGYGDF